MAYSLTQELRYKLQKRFRKVRSAGYQSIHFALLRFWRFLNENATIKGILDQLEADSASATEDAESILGGTALQGESDEEEVRLSYRVLKSCVESGNAKIETTIAHRYCNEQRHDDALEYFKELLVEPLYDYIDEQLDDQRAILSVLRKWKHKCEWFQRMELANHYETSAKQSKGEKALALRLYEYLHDQGIHISIEPTSASGEADLVSAQEAEDPLIADVKIFDPSAGKAKTYIINAVQQVYQYACDYNEPFGYLVIFKTCENDLEIKTSQHEQATPFITHNGKSIFFLVVDLFAHTTSASKRGQLKAYSIEESEIVAKLSAVESSAEDAVEPDTSAAAG